MPDAPSPDLNLVPTEDLVSELRNRSPVGLVLVLQPNSTINDIVPYSYTWGALHEQVGLITMLHHTLNRQLDNRTLALPLESIHPEDPDDQEEGDE